MNPHHQAPLPPNDPRLSIPRRAVMAGICLVACAAALAGCSAARMVPGELQYSGDAVVNWTAEVFGIEPKRY